MSSYKNVRGHPRRLFPFALPGLLLIAFSTYPADAQVRQRIPTVRQGQTQQLTGPEALRMLHKTGNFRDTETFAYKMLWQDVRQPEVLYLLGSAQERLRKPQEAATAYALYLRVLDEGGAADAGPDAAKQRTIAERRLKALRRDDAALTAAYAKKAPGKKFETPENVDDGWMDNVRSDLFSLHGLYAWKLVGGRKDAQPDWVHNTKGSLHHSGAKLVDEAEGRKGLLFTVPLKDKDSADADESNRQALQKLGHNSRMEARNVGGCRVARVGARGYGFPFVLKVIVDGKEVHSEEVGTDAWSEVKVELPAFDAQAAPTEQKPGAKPRAAESGQRVVLEFIVPEGQKWSEGLWIDYFDFFEN